MTKYDPPTSLGIPVRNIPPPSNGRNQTTFQAMYHVESADWNVGLVPFGPLLALLRECVPDIYLGSWQGRRDSVATLEFGSDTLRMHLSLTSVSGDDDNPPPDVIGITSSGRSRRTINRWEGLLRYDPLQHAAAAPLLARLHALAQEYDKDVWANCIVRGGDGNLNLHRFALRLPEHAYPLDVAYGTGMAEWHDAVKQHVKDTTSGILLLHGPPGTGKTSYIRHLLRDLAGVREPLFLTRALAQDVASPQVIPLILRMAEQDRSPILVIEDAEHMLMSREASDPGGSDLVSLILNLSDGLLNDLCRCQVVATFNTDLRNVDKALLRRGRLIAERKFDLLPVGEAKRLAAIAGCDPDAVTRPTSLGDILGEAPVTAVPSTLNGASRSVGFGT